MMETVQNHVSDVLRVRPLSKNYMVHFLWITAALEKNILNKISKRNGMNPDPYDNWESLHGLRNQPYIKQTRHFYTLQGKG